MDIDAEDQRSREAAKAYIGEFAWPTLLLAVVLGVAYFGAVVAVGAGQLSYLMAAPLLMLLTYASYTVMHEAVHGSISGSHSRLRMCNDLAGYLAGWVLMIPLTAHRHEHLAHHRNTNQGEDDPDAIVATMTRSPWQAVSVASRMLVSQYAYYFRQRWSKSPASQNLRFCLEVGCIIVLRIYLLSLGETVPMLLLMLTGTLGGVLITLYLFAYLVHQPHKAVGRYVDTSVFVMPGWRGKVLTALWGYQNYHAIHHLFPRVPFYRYTRLYKEIEPILLKKGTPVYHLSLPFRGQFT
jgi:beta-carotene hydroxylase